LGLARTGSFSGNGSGDFTIAFTTGRASKEELKSVTEDNKGDGFLSPVYAATVEATEEAIVNALFKAETMTGQDGNVRHGLPYDQVSEIFERYGRTVIG
jgi:D-aminopeptidase